VQQQVEEGGRHDGEVLPLPVQLVRQLPSSSEHPRLSALTRPSRDPLLRIHSELVYPMQLAGGSVPPMAHLTRVVSAPVRLPSAS